MATPSRKLFLSTVSSEHGDDRRILKATLVGPFLEVKEQTDFINLGGDTLAMLDKYIATCNGVVHLLGDATGSYPDPINIRDLLERHTDLPAKLSFLPDIAANGHRYSYTQWEAYLAIYYGIALYLFRPTDDAPRGPNHQPDDTCKTEQLSHRLRLQAISRYGKTFPNIDKLCILVLQELVNANYAPFLTDEAKRLVPPYNLPLVGRLFKGRDEFLDQLRSVLKNKPTHIAAVTAKQAIHGLGGVGKTRVAVEYAKRYAHEYTALLFVTGDSASNLERNLANLCGALVLNLPERDAKEQEVQVAAAIRWLREHTGWFLIVDNVDTPEAATAIKTLMQKFDTGHIVITSRLSNWGQAVEELPLDVISETAAKELLLEFTVGKRKPTPTDEAEASALANDLGCLPLALEQSGAYIAEAGCSFAEYRKLWKAQDDEVLKWHSHLMHYPRSVATTWRLSFGKVGKDGQNLLRVLCWLAPDPIPLAMLEKAEVGEGKSSLNVKKARRDLARYSFVKWADELHTSIVVHRLVQEITEYRLPKDKRLDWLKRSLKMVDEFCVGDPHDVLSWKEIYTPARPHLFAITQTADESGIAEPTSRLIHQLALYLDTRSEHAEAEPLMRRVVRMFETSLGESHPNVAGAINNLAGLLRATNQLAEAEPLMQRALAIDNAYYGNHHPYVARDLNNLARLFQDTNRLVDAESMMRQALAMNEASYGNDHFEIAISLNNLAALLLQTNRSADAEPLMRRALAIDEARNGRDHPRVARDLNNLAVLFHATNRFVEAEPLMLRALAIDEASYGNDHPAVATSLNNLGQLLQATNRLAEAEPLMLRALAIDEASYGNDHPQVARDLNNLALLLQATNRLSEAEPLMRRHLVIFVLFQMQTGHSHPHLESAVDNYAGLLKQMGQSEELIQQTFKAIFAEAEALAATK